MDLQLAKTFLAILAEGNFVNAAGSLHVTQSAVSLRVQKLERELGREIFVRTKSGTELTSAGAQFERFARSLLRVWDEAKYQVGVPAGFTDTLIIGSFYGLWPRLTSRWLLALEQNFPNIAFRAEVGMSDRLMKLLVEGTLDVAVMYTPQLRPGLRVETLIKDELVLASADPEYTTQLDDRYILVDWGPEFIAAHALQYPDFSACRTTLSLGGMGINYIIDRGRAGYLPARLVKQHLKSGRLHIVPNAPVFPYPAYLVWNEEKSAEIMGPALTLLRTIASTVDDEQRGVLEDAGLDGEENRMPL